MKRLSLVTQFKIEFLLPPTGCTKVLGKMPAHIVFEHFKFYIFGNLIG